MSEEAARLIREVVAAFDRGGVEAVLEHFAPDVEWVGPPDWLEDPVYCGHDGLRKLAGMWTGAFDDYRVDLAEEVDTGARFVALLYQRGRMKGSGDPMEQPIGWVIETGDGLITRVEVFFSWEEALRAA